MKHRVFSLLLAALLTASTLIAFAPEAMADAPEEPLKATVPFDVPEDEDGEAGDGSKSAPESLSERFLNFPASYQKILKKGKNAFSADRLYENFDTVYATLCEAWNHGVFKDVDYKVDPESDGVADTRGTGNDFRSLITMYSRYYASQNYKEVDSITHELTHVCQINYRTGYGGADTDDSGSWIVEGMTDYSRYTYGMYPDAFQLYPYSANQSYTDSYRITARFFVWVEQNVCPTLTEQLNEALRTEVYSSKFFDRITGYSLKDLWAMYAADQGRIVLSDGKSTTGAVTRK